MKPTYAFYLALHFPALYYSNVYFVRSSLLFKPYNYHNSDTGKNITSAEKNTHTDKIRLYLMMCEAGIDD